MKVCFVGTGSMGRRHIRNLTEIAHESNMPIVIDVLRHNRGGELSKEIQPMIHGEYYLPEELPQDYDAVFITNPTAKHYETLKALMGVSDCFFVEKPLFEKAEYDTGFIKDGKQIYVACPLRYMKVVQHLKKLCSERRIFSARVICSSYLPEWRPNTDYRKGYSARSELGGGVEMDLIHEWDYITDLFGFPRRVMYIGGRYSNLEIDTHDNAVYIAEYADKTVSLHIDYFGRVPRREVEIFAEDDTICANLITGQITYLKEGKSLDLFEDRDAFQKREIRHFLDLLVGKTCNCNDPKRALCVLRLTKGEL